MSTLDLLQFLQDHALLRAIAFILNLLGWISLTALLITVNLSERIYRHPVFINFLCTWVLYSSFEVFVGLADFSLLASYNGQFQSLGLPSTTTWNLTNELTDLAVGLFKTTLQDVLWMITQVSTLNLVIHLWYTMKLAERSVSRRAEKRCTAILVMSPYLLGLLPLVEFVPLGCTPCQFSVSLWDALLIVITSIWDLILLIKFYRRRKILKTVKLETTMSLSVLAKMLVFCGYRLILTSSLLAAGISGSRLTYMTNINFIAQSLYPLVTFILLGFGREVLHIWFPCILKPLENVPTTRPTDY